MDNQARQDDEELERENASLAVIPHDVALRNDQGRVYRLRCTSSDDSVPSMLPREIGNLNMLKVLHLKDMPALTALPGEIQNLDQLQEFSLTGCSSLTTLPPEIGKLSNLEFFQVCACTQVNSLPPEIGQLQKLKHLKLCGRSFGSSFQLHLPLEMSQLKSLETVDPGNNGEIFDFIQKGGMSGWASLKSLDVYTDSKHSDDEYLSLLRFLPSWLTKLRLAHDNDGRLYNLCLKTQLPPRLRILNVGLAVLQSSNDTDKESLVVDLLQRNKYLGGICYDFNKKNLYSPLAEHYMDTNEAGRCLVEGDRPIPLSVWPTVLERVNRKCPRHHLALLGRDYKLKRRANVMYYMLQGPVFAGRHDFVNDCKRHRES